jgi:phage shock protein PspC (stress-responsive transcriptional regulator)
MVAGVAAGIADRLGVERWVVRLAFVLLSAGGGSGVLLYVAAWLLMPEEGESISVGQRWANQANSTRPWIGVLLVLIAAAILFSNLPFFDGGLLFPTALLVIGILLYRGDLPGIQWKAKPRDPTTPAPNYMETTDMSTASDSSTLTQTIAPVVSKPRTPPSPLGRITVGVAIISLGLLAVIDRITPAMNAEPRHYFALAVTILGLGILTGTFVGRARWLIPIGLLLLPPMIGTSVADAYDGSWQTPQLVRPAQFASMEPRYEKDAGELIIDLTELPWAGETVTVAAEVGAGVIDLRVPPGVRVEATGDVGIGEFATDGDSHGGFGVNRTFIVEGHGTGTVLANLEVGVGRIEVNSGDDPFILFRGDEFALEQFGDLVVNVDSSEALEESYTTAQGDITLDLAGLTLEGDRVVEVATDIGDITVILPIDTSYRVVARTDHGVVDLFGEDRIDRGGSVRSDSITTGQPVIELNIQSIDGDITLTQGERE